jgi:hypothetical protein
VNTVHGNGSLNCVVHNLESPINFSVQMNMLKESKHQYLSELHVYYIQFL